MPYSVRLYCITGLDPIESKSFDVPWWPQAVLNELPGHRDMYRNSPYVDYLGGMSPEDAIRFDQVHWDEAIPNEAYHEGHKHLMELLLVPDAVQWVLVKVYEWESGLA